MQISSTSLHKHQFNKNAQRINKLDWGNKELGTYFVEKILGFGTTILFPLL